jgi:hypothetical protein
MQHAGYFFNENKGYKRTLTPLAWYSAMAAMIATGRRQLMRRPGPDLVARVPVPFADSLLIIDTPDAVIFNANDAAPRRVLLEQIRAKFNPAGKTAIALKSYSPASAAALTFKNGIRSPLKTKKDFVQVAIGMSNALGASYFVPFASQAFFNREDSKWANDHKVTYENLSEYWSGTKTMLCQPFVTMDLKSFAWTSAYDSVKRSLTDAQVARVHEEEQQEKSFVWPEQDTVKLKNYLDEIYFLRWLYRKGIGWRLTTSGRELFYRTKTRTVETTIPAAYDFVISLPDKVLDDALNNGILTDLGITLFVRVDTKVHLKLAYLFFILMNLRDYGHFKTVRDFLDIVRFYLPVVFPKLFRIAPRGDKPLAIAFETASPIKA